jgi:hypothetical protein
VHYALRRAFAPAQVQLLLPADNPNTVSVEVQYDEAGPVPAPLNIKVYLQPLGGDAKFGACPAATLVADVKTPAGQRARVPVWSMGVDALLAKRAGCTRETCFVRVSATETAAPQSAARARRGAGSILGVGAGEAQESTLFFKKYNQLALPEITLKPSNFKQVDAKTVEFTVASANGTAVAAFWDAAPAGYFSTNAVELRPCEPLKVTFHAVDPVKAGDLERTLAIWTINGALQGKQQGALALYGLTKAPAGGKRGAKKPAGKQHHKVARALLSMPDF